MKSLVDIINELGGLRDSLLGAVKEDEQLSISATLYLAYRLDQIKDDLVEVRGE